MHHGVAAILEVWLFTVIEGDNMQCLDFLFVTKKSRMSRDIMNF